MQHFQLLTMVIYSAWNVVTVENKTEVPQKIYKKNYHVIQQFHLQEYILRKRKH